MKKGQNWFENRCRKSWKKKKANFKFTKCIKNFSKISIRNNISKPFLETSKKNSRLSSAMVVSTTNTSLDPKIKVFNRKAGIQFVNNLNWLIPLLQMLFSNKTKKKKEDKDYSLKTSKRLFSVWQPNRRNLSLSSMITKKQRQLV